MVEPESSFFVLKVLPVPVAESALGTFFDIFNIFFKLLIFLYNRIIPFFSSLKYFFATALLLSLKAIAFLYSSKSFSISSNKKLIFSSLTCYVDFTGLRLLIITHKHQF